MNLHPSPSLGAKLAAATLATAVLPLLFVPTSASAETHAAHPAPAARAQSSSSAWKALRNARVNLGGTTYQLRDGRALGAPAAPGSAMRDHVRVLPRHVVGNLDDKAGRDVAAIVTVDPGGSGTFFYLVVLHQGRNGSIQVTPGVFLGDRIAVDGVAIKDQKVVLRFRDHDRGQAMSADPAHRVLRRYELAGPRLVDVTRGEAGSTMCAPSAGAC